eukprot:255468-Prymnesium_polylepis.1
MSNAWGVLWALTVVSQKLHEPERDRICTRARPTSALDVARARITLTAHTTLHGSPIDIVRAAVA